MNIISKLATVRTLLADGATGTYLQSRGLVAGGDPELMNITHPKIVSSMAADYFRAGSDLVQTNSFGGTFYVQNRYEHGDKVDEINYVAAKLARAGADDPKLNSKERYVFGSNCTCWYDEPSRYI